MMLLSFTLSLLLPTQSFSATTTTNNSIKTKTLGLISFDLDDTLFPILPVVQEANEAMFAKLSEFGYDDATEEGYHTACKQIRREMYDNSKIKEGTSNVKTITYSELRQRGIHLEMKACQTNNPTKERSNVDEDQIVQDSFNAWLSERHASADRHLFSSTLPMLESLKQQHPHAFIVAVTNGRGNPMDMPRISQFFDLCVSGEDEDVFPCRKPHPKIFEATLTKTHRLKSSSSTIEGKDDCLEVQNDGTMIMKKSYCWIHVGDDLANDVGASKRCGANTVWIHQSELEELKKKPNFVTTASKEEQEARKKLNEESLGAVDVKIECLSELKDAVDSILKQ